MATKVWSANIVESLADKRGRGSTVLMLFRVALTVYAVCVPLLCPNSLAGQEASATHAPINGPSALASDNVGHLFVVEMKENKVLRITLRNGTISTVAGTGKKCCYREGAKATEVSLDFLRALAVDLHGNLFISENRQIRRIDAVTGLISTVVGDGASGDTIDGINARSAHFWDVDALAVDHEGNLFASDEHQGRIFKIDMNTDVVHHFAGSGKFGFAGDGGPARDASFRFPSGLVIDAAGDVVLTDFENCAIRRIHRETGTIETVAVSGGPEQNCMDRPNNSRPGAFPSEPTSDIAGNIYFVESAMDFVMRIDSNTSEVSVVAGNGRRGFSGDSGPANKAQLANPSGLAIDSDGNIFISEFVNNRIRRIDARTKVITTVAGNGLPHRIDFEM